MENRIDITQLRSALSQKWRGAESELLILVDKQLHGMMRGQPIDWQREGTLNTTQLIQEAYDRVVGEMQLDLESRKRYFRVAAKVMRNALLDHARAKKSQRADFEKALELTEEEADRLIALDAVLTRLEQHNLRLSEVIECRFFAGLSVDDTATILNLSPRTVERDWNRAKAWLYRELSKSQEIIERGSDSWSTTKSQEKDAEETAAWAEAEKLLEDQLAGARQMNDRLIAMAEKLSALTDQIEPITPQSGEAE